MASVAVLPLSAPHQDEVVRRTKRTRPPPFPYSSRYPEPDPDDPFAPLSVLRNRTSSVSRPLDEGIAGVSARYTSYIQVSAAPVGREKSEQPHPFKDLAS